MITVGDIMTRNVQTVKPSMDVLELAKLFVAKGYSGAPVVDDSGKLLGLVLEENLIVKDMKIHVPTVFYLLSGGITFGEKRFENEMKMVMASTVGELMTKVPVVLKPSVPVEDVATIVVDRHINYFPVLEGGQLVGVVTKKDIIKAIAQKKI
jgi:CBS domain-containing protein